MTVVRMLFDMQGWRADGREWPGYNGEIDVPEEEAQAMVSNAIAEYPSQPPLDRGYRVLNAPDIDYEHKMRLADSGIANEEEFVDDDDYDNDINLNDSDSVVDDHDFDRDDDEPEEPVIEQVKKPYANASKAEWVAYAVAKGHGKDDAWNMTKAQLIAEYSDL